MAPVGIEPTHGASKAPALSSELRGRTTERVPGGPGVDDEVADGTRTRDHRDHNPGLYQLSYCHRAALIVPR